MSDLTEKKPKPFLRTIDAANHLAMGKSTLEKLRLTGNGPKFCKLGTRVVYQVDELDRWAMERTIGSTSESVKG